jgi:predicted Zn-dependent protease
MPSARHAALLLIASLTTALLPGCASNPATGGSSVVVSSQGREVTIGDEMHREMLEKGAAYDKPELEAYVNRIGQRLVANSDKPSMKFTFTVIDSPDINAFALPGGYIYINRGLLAYLDTEAELAGVLSHEIGHVTARHHGRQQTAGITNKVLATTVYILTGSGDIADASNMYGTELISGYGRDMELEADGLGAEYMHKSGYDTEALLEVIGVLKDQERFQRVKAKSGGKTVSTYHGLYASHPRNDQRLKKVIQTASELDMDNYVEDPAVPGEFKRHMEGLVWGESVQSERSESRYYHTKLAFTFEQPQDWLVTAGSQAVVARAPQGDAELTLKIRRRDQASSPRSVLEANAKGSLRDGAQLDQAGLKGYTAIASGNGSSRRLAVIDYGNLSYLFEGHAQDFPSKDAQLLAIIESFRPSHPRERTAATGRYIHYIQVPRGATMASLAASIRIPNAEAQLRLINGLYPGGEPRTGDWIKIIK